MLARSLVTLLLGSSVALALPAQAQFIAEPLCDVLKGAIDSNPQSFVEAGNDVFFVANNGTGGRVVYRAASPSVCVPIDLGLGDAGYEPTELTPVGSDLYWLTLTQDEGFEIGAFVGGIPFHIVIQSGIQSGVLSGLTAFQGSVYFTGIEDSIVGGELWRVTVATPSLVQDLGPSNIGSAPTGYWVVGNRLYFEAFTPDTGRDLFAWTGTSLVTIDVDPGAGGSEIVETQAVGDTLFFTNADSAVYAVNAGSSDATLVGQFQTAGGLGALGAALIFAADDGVNGQELHTSDGQTATRHDLAAGAADGRVGMLTPAGDGDRVWLNGDNATNQGKELHLFHMGSGQFESFDLNPGPSDSQPFGLTPYDNEAVTMGAEVAGFGEELVTAIAGDGPDGSVLDLSQGPNSSFPDMLTRVDAETIFLRATTTFGMRLVAQTRIGGVMGSEIVPIQNMIGPPQNMTALGGDLYFSVQTSTEGREPYFVRVPEPRAGIVGAAALVGIAGIARRARSRGAAADAWRDPAPRARARRARRSRAPVS